MTNLPKPTIWYNKPNTTNLTWPNHPHRQDPINQTKPTKHEPTNQSNLTNPTRSTYPDLTNPTIPTLQPTQPEILSKTQHNVPNQLELPNLTITHTLRTDLHKPTYMAKHSLGFLVSFRIFWCIVGIRAFFGPVRWKFLTGPLKSSWIFLEPVLDENLWSPLPTCVRHSLLGEAFNESGVWLWCWPSFLSLSFC